MSDTGDGSEQLPANLETGIPSDAIVPPASFNVSAAALAGAEAFLDEETRAILAAKRADQLFQTGALSLAVAAALELDPDTAKTFGQALVDRVSQLSPPHREHVNRLLAGIGATFNEQADGSAVAGHDVIARMAATRSFAGHVLTLVSRPGYPADGPAAGGDAAGAGAETAAGAGKDDGSDDGSRLGQDEPESEAESGINMEDVIMLPDGLELFRHEIAPKHMLGFINDIIGSKQRIANLSTRAVSLIAWQLLQEYRQIKRSGLNSDRVETQYERSAQYIGLFEPAKKAAELAELYGVLPVTLTSGLRRVREALSAVLSPERTDEIIKKAVATDLYMTSIEDARANAGLEGDGGEGTGTDDEAEELDIEARELVVHDTVPEAQLDFLRRTLPTEFEDEVATLDPYQSAWLVSRLVNTFKTRLLVSESPGHHDQIVLTCSIAEMHNGLFGEPLSESETAAETGLGIPNVAARLEAIPKRLKSLLSPEQLDALFDEAQAQVRQVNDGPVRS